MRYKTNDKNRGMQGGTRFLDIELFQGASMNNFYWMEGCWSDEFQEWSFLYRVFYFHVSMTFKRPFYYGPFCATTGAVRASGLGYNGIRKDPKTG